MTTLGKYELLHSLGAGATAEVFLARDITLDRLVALKLLRPALIQDAASFARFAQEARAAAGLFHPNIATVLEMGEAAGRFFIALRYVDGPSLDQRLREGGRLPFGEALRLAQQVGDALDFAHRKGFLHRDVKPANILCDAEGDYILTDFGLTKAMMSTGLSSHTGAVLGTPAYIPPEVWLNQPITPAADQYALACVLFEAITGQALFTGDTPPAVMASHMLAGPRFPDTWPEGVPQGIGQVLMKALAREPGQRFQTAREFAAALGKSGDKETGRGGEREQQQVKTPGEPAAEARVAPRARPMAEPKPVLPPTAAGERMIVEPAAPPPTPMRMESQKEPSPPPAVRTSGGWSSRKTLLIASGIVLALAVIFVIGLFIAVQNYSANAPQAQPTQVAAVESAATSAPVVESPSIATLIPTSTATPPPPTATPTATILPTATQTGGGAGKIAFFSKPYNADPKLTGPWKIYVMDAGGANPVQLAGNNGDNWDPAWSPDGSKIAFNSNQDGNDEIYVMNADGSNPVRLTNDKGDDWAPDWSPDGRQIAFTSNRSGDYEIYVMNADGSNPVNLTNTPGDDLQPAWSPDGKRIAYWAGRNGSYGNFVMNADGSNPIRLEDKEANGSYPVWSPDGKQIAIGLHEGIYVMNADGTGTGHLVTNVVNDWCPSWSPDGKQIIYTSGDEQNEEIYSVNLESGALTRLTNNNSYDRCPVWQPRLPGQ